MKYRRIPTSSNDTKHILDIIKDLRDDMQLTQITTPNPPINTTSLPGQSTGSSGADQLVRISDDDDTADFLENKIAAGRNIIITVLNNGATEELEIEAIEIVDTLPVWIDSPVSDEGRVVYDLDTNKLYYGSNTEWVECGGGGTGSLAHTDLTDMPSSSNSDHDGRYYTETEVNGLIHWDRTGTDLAPKVNGDTILLTGGEIRGISTDILMVGSTLKMWESTGDPDTDNPKIQMNHLAGLTFGPGGATSPDNALQRIGPKLMQFSKNLRIGGPGGAGTERGFIQFKDGVACDPPTVAGDINLYQDSERLYVVTETPTTKAVAFTADIPTGAQYLTLATDAQLSSERVFTAGIGVTVTDGGAGSTYTVAAPLTDGLGITCVNAGAGTGYTINSNDPWIIVKKTSDQSKSTDNTIANDSVLTFTAAAASIYILKGTIFITESAINDFQWSILDTQAPVSAYGMYQYILPSALTTLVSTFGTALPSAVVMDTTGNGSGIIKFEYTINTHATNSGTVGFAWAQRTSGLGAAIVLKGSFIEYQKLA